MICIKVTVKVIFLPPKPFPFPKGRRGKKNSFLPFEAVVNLFVQG